MAVLYISDCIQMGIIIETLSVANSDSYTNYARNEANKMVVEK
jgi:hypothetical protein